MPAPKHTEAAIAIHPAPRRDAFKTAEGYAKACMDTDQSRSEFDKTKPAKAQVSTKPGKSTTARSGSSKNRQMADKAGKTAELPKLTTVQMLDDVGVETISRRIIEGESMTAIATSFGIGVGSLRYWVSLDITRSAHVREARSLTGAACDDEALDRIDAAMDVFELAKAREAAQHLRWRAKAIAPKEYGDKVNVEQTIKFADLTDEQIEARLAALEEE